MCMVMRQPHLPVGEAQPEHVIDEEGWRRCGEQHDNVAEVKLHQTDIWAPKQHRVCDVSASDLRVGRLQTMLERDVSESVGNASSKH